jgi:hypothetical protein
MDQDLEFLLFLLGVIIFIASWIYQRVRTSASRRRSRMPVGNIALPIPTFTGLTGRSLPRVAIPSALGSFFGVLIGSLAFAIWVYSQVSVPSNVARAAVLFPVWFCIGAPLISTFSAIAVTIADNVFREFQAKSLPRGLPFVLGALIGLAFAIVSAGFSLTIPCGLLDLC